MAKHKQGQECESCNEKLNLADPRLREFFLDMKKTYENLHCSWTHRTKEEQDKCNQNRSSYLVFPKSKHNKLPSLAIDLFQINEFGAGVWDSKFLKDLNELQKKRGHDLKWGGEFKGRSAGDFDHFEIKDNT